MPGIFKKIRTVHKDRDGQAIIVIALVMFTIVCFFALTINVGHRITAKVEMQNAADAAVMSGAIWNARGMNMICILNVGMTECLALIIMFRAFYETCKIVEIALPINEAVAAVLSAIPFTAAAGAIWQAGLKIARALLTSVIKPVANAMNNLAKDDGALWKLMDGLQMMSKGIKTAAPIAAAYEAHMIAGLNGADPLVSVGSVTYRALFLPLATESLPVKEGTFKDLCKPTVGDGGHHYKEYLNWRAPFTSGGKYNALGMKIGDFPVGVHEMFTAIYTITLLAVIPPPGLTYFFYAKYLSNSICSGETGFDTPEGIEKITTNCDECDPDKHKIKEQEWLKQDGKLEIANSNYTDCKMPGTSSPKTPSNYITKTTETVKTIKKPKEPCMQCKIIKVTYTVNCPCSESGCKNCSGDPPKGTKTIVAYYKTDHKVLKKCIYLEKGNAAPISAGGNKPKPYILDDNWQKHVKYTALVKKNVSDRLAFGSGGSDSEKSTWATAQAEMYNPTQAWMFNQDWQVRLKPWIANDVDISVLGFDIKDKLPDSIKDAVSKGLSEFIVH